MDRGVGGAKRLQLWGLPLIALASFVAAGFGASGPGYDGLSHQDEAGRVMRVGSGDTKHTAVSPHARAQAITIFGERCAVCHGIDGGGEGPASSNLNPKPPNFHDRKWQRSVSDERMAKAIVDGGASVGLSEAMASNPDLQGRPDVVAALVEHIRRQARAK
jgi:cytochrome c553